MINSNLKTQVQARINAITTSTTLAELLRIRQAAKGLNCDETLLNNEVTAKLNVLSGATSLDDLVAAGVLTDSPSKVLHYQAPHAVMPGDELWIDGLGLVTDRQYPYSAVASAVEVMGYPGQANTFITSSFRTGYVRQTGAESTFLIALSDGNWLLGIGSPVDAPQSQYGFKLYVLSAGRDKILTSTTVELKLSGSFDSMYSYTVGIREISTNVFRVYYTQAASGSTNPTSLAFHTLTYNTGSKAITGAAGSVVHTLGSGDFNASRAARRHNQGQRWQVIGSSSDNLLCLDMQNGTITNYSGPGLGGFPETEFDESTAGNEWAVVSSSGGVRQLAKAGTSTTKALPSNLVSDGCFGVGWSIRMLEPRRFLAKRANAGVCIMKVVAFDAAYDTATIWALDAAHPDTASSYIGAVFKRTDGLYIVENFAVGPSAFYWDGASAPTNYRTHRKTFRNIGDVKAGSIQSTDKIARSAYTESSNSAGTIARSTAIISMNAGVALSWAPAKIGRVLTNTAAASLAEVELYDNSRYIGDDLRTGADSPTAQMVTTKLALDLSSAKFAVWSSSGSIDEGDFVSGHATEYDELKNAGATVSLGSGAAVAFDGGKSVYASAGRTADTGRSASLLTLHTFSRFNDFQGSPATGCIYRAKSNKPFVLFVSGQSSNIAEGE